MKITIPTLTLLILLSGCREVKENNNDKIVNPNNKSKFYSKAVNDTFDVSISLPNDYNSATKETYPIVYLLDANLYFEIVAAIFKNYSEVGLLPPAILIGIGYKDLQTMDSLRSRDFTFPIAIPEYEMSLSGGADKFLSFINNELIPDNDSKYRIDKSKRILMGHSLGGYFTLYAMQQSLLNKTTLFHGYIAASPSTDYNHNYILKEFEKLTESNPTNIKSYISFGGLEDEEEEDSTQLKSNTVLSSLSKSLKENNKINFKGDIYSNLLHMDTSLPTFVNGLQWTLN
jgi:predicted alpha/beta superfamily hydrolase